MRQAMNRYTCTVAALAFVWLGVAGSAPAAPTEAPQPVAPAPSVGLAVQPGGLLIQNVTPGELYDIEKLTGIALTIFNRDDREHTYALSTHRPSEIGNRHVPAGYTDIVDPSWLWFQMTEVRVPAQGEVKVRMYLKIPNEQRYWGQHWSVSIGVGGKPGPGETLALAVHPRFEIEIAEPAKADATARSPADLGTLVFSGAKPGAHQERRFEITNRDNAWHRYRFRAVSREEAVAKQYASAGDTWVADPQWVRPRWPGARSSAGRALRVPVDMALPDRARVPRGGCQALILVERDDGETGLVRVHLIRSCRRFEGRMCSNDQ